MRDSGQPENSSPAKLEERRLGATRSFTANDAGRYEEPGQPGASVTGTARGCSIRGNPKKHRWHRWRVRNSGQPGDPRAGGPRERGFGATRRFTFGTAEGCVIRGNSKIRLSELPEDAGFGETRKLIGGDAGGVRIRGDPENQLSASPKDAGFEETRRTIAGTVLRCRMRGNPKPHRKTEWDDA